ncbi:MAG: phage holin family protein [bacterium]
MKRLFWHWFISTLALMAAAAALQQGVHVPVWYNAVWIAPLLGLVNFVVGLLSWLLKIIILPINILTLGLFGFILSLGLYTWAIYFLCQKDGPLYPYFYVDGFYWALGLSVVMALFSTLLNMLLPGKKDRK